MAGATNKRHADKTQKHRRVFLMSQILNLTGKSTLVRADRNQEGPALDGLAGCDLDPIHGARPRSSNLVLHLHGFEHEKDRSRLDMVPLRHANLDDASVHERPDLLDTPGFPGICGPDGSRPLSSDRHPPGPSSGNHVHALTPGSEAPPGELTAAGEEQRQPAIGDRKSTRLNS